MLHLQSDCSRTANRIQPTTPSQFLGSSSQRWRLEKSLAAELKLGLVASLAFVARSSALTPYSCRTISTPTSLFALGGYACAIGDLSTVMPSRHTRIRAGPITHIPSSSTSSSLLRALAAFLRRPGAPTLLSACPNIAGLVCVRFLFQDEYWPFPNPLRLATGVPSLVPSVWPVRCANNEG
jgi:hypothetical protein